MTMSQQQTQAALTRSAYLYQILNFARENPKVVKFLAVLLALDSFFIAIFLINGISIALLDGDGKFPPFWSLAADYSAPELYGYLKLFAASALLFSVYKRSRTPVFASWAFMFLALLADDALLIHEYGGEWIAALVSDGPMWNGIQIHHIGELAVWAILGVLCLNVLIIGHLKSNGKEIDYSKLLLFSIFGLTFCGVGIDLISSFDFVMHADKNATLLQVFYGVLIIAEDGGELVFMSLACAIAYFAWLNVPKHSAILND